MPLFGFSEAKQRFTVQQSQYGGTSRLQLSMRTPRNHYASTTRCSMEKPSITFRPVGFLVFSQNRRISGYQGEDVGHDKRIKSLASRETGDPRKRSVQNILVGNAGIQSNPHDGVIGCRARSPSMFKQIPIPAIR